MISRHPNLTNWPTYVNVSKHYRLGRSPHNPFLISRAPSNSLIMGHAKADGGHDMQGRQSAPISTSGSQGGSMTRPLSLPTSSTAHAPQVSPGVTTGIATQAQNRSLRQAVPYGLALFFDRTQRAAQPLSHTTSKPDNMTNLKWDLLKDAWPVGYF